MQLVAADAATFFFVLLMLNISLLSSVSALHVNVVVEVGGIREQPNSRQPTAPPAP